MIHTKIEWCDSTVNPTENCDGCELWKRGQGGACYAGKITERMRGKGAFDQPVVLKPGRMAAAAAWPSLAGQSRPDKPWLGTQPRVIFVGDMADTLSRKVPFKFLRDEIIQVVDSAAGRQHTWMWLTKQAKRLEEFRDWLVEQKIAWPANLWPGVSVTRQRTTWRLNHLVTIPAKVRFVSYEPAREYVDFTPWLTSLSAGGEGRGEVVPRISLMIVGGESGSHRFPFNLQWAADTIADCRANQVACFIKQIGSYAVCENANLFDFPDDSNLRTVRYLPGLAAGRVVTTDPKGGNWTEWPDQLRVREWPGAPVSRPGVTEPAFP
jgi:protein gp37